jgi:hypothetical protein
VEDEKVRLGPPPLPLLTQIFSIIARGGRREDMNRTSTLSFLAFFSAKLAKYHKLKNTLREFIGEYK